jgi:hypothetical protein
MLRFLSRLPDLFRQHFPDTRRIHCDDSQIAPPLEWLPAAIVSRAHADSNRL